MAKQKDYLDIGFNDLLQREEGLGYPLGGILGSQPSDVDSSQHQAYSAEDISAMGASGGVGGGSVGGSAESVVEDGASLSDLWITNFIKSENWKQKTTGFYLDGQKNYAEFSNVYVSGEIEAVLGKIGGWTINSTSIYTGTEDHSGYTANAGDITIYSDETNSSVHARNFYIDTSGNLTCAGANIGGSTITTPTITGIQSGSEIAIQGWQSTLVFAASDYRTVGWSAGNDETITLLDGTVYTFTAGNTGNMAALTYIYLDIASSTTVLQTTTTAATAVGTGKILIAVAQNNSDASSDATFQAYGGSGGVLIKAANIASDTITANEIAANTITGSQITGTTLSAIYADLGTITAGSISVVAGANTIGLTPSGGNAIFSGTTGSPEFKVTPAGALTAKKITTGGLALVVASGESVQTAVNTCNSAGGGTVLLQTGTHTLTDDLTLYSEVSLKGQTAASTIIDFGSAAYQIKIIGSNNYSTGTVTIANGATTVEGAGVTWTGAMAGRDILLSGIWYLIASVTDSDTLEIALPFAGEALSGSAYIIADPINSIHLSVLTIKNSTTAAIKIQYAKEIFIEDVDFQVNATILDIDDSANITLHAIDSAYTTSDSVQINNSYFIDARAFGLIDSATHALILNGCANISLSACYIMNAATDGLNMTDCDNIGIITSNFTENGGQGVELVSGCTNISMVNMGCFKNASDGIKMTGTDDRNIIMGSVLEDNGGYGVNIAAADCDDNVVMHNVYNNNSSGDINDSGTGTIKAITNAGTFYYGDGSDGALSTSGNETLTEDKYYTNLTINTGDVFNPAGYRIFVNDTLTLSGTGKITRNGNDGGDGNFSTGGDAGATLATGYLIGSVAGKAGGTGENGGGATAGSAGTAVVNSLGSNGTAGGTGGNATGAGAAGGVGGVATTSNVKLIANWHLETLLDVDANGSTVKYTTSAGAGSGGGAARDNGVGGSMGGGGGGSASGGGLIAVYARTAIIGASAIIETNGGNGGDGANGYLGTSGGGGGGAGANGGEVVLVYNSLTNDGTLQSLAGSGGSGGTAAGGGNNGTAGAAGTAGTVRTFNVSFQ